MRFLSGRQFGEVEKSVLVALLEGWTLKSHRTLDGQKIFQLHPLAGPPQHVDPAVVARLTSQGLLQSNQKFPAATYLLTDYGRGQASRLTSSPARPLTASRFGVNDQAE